MLSCPARFIGKMDIGSMVEKQLHGGQVPVFGCGAERGPFPRRVVRATLVDVSALL